METDCPDHACEPHPSNPPQSVLSAVKKTTERDAGENEGLKLLVVSSLSFCRRSHVMKKRTLVVLGALVVACAIFAFTPPGKALIEIALFAASADRYFRDEAQTEKKIMAMSADEFRDLAKRVETLLKDSAHVPEKTDTIDRDGIPIPESLAYLKPQRIWISEDGATVELLHMMDSDTTLFVERSKDGSWSVSGHFGDYMNPRRLLWAEAKVPAVGR